jgi:uncharacterized protein (TIGR02300 family)
LADPALGAKQICPNCQAKFYDLGRRPAHCPKCGQDFDPEEAVKFRRIRARAVTPDYETDEEAEDQVKAKEPDDELEEEDVVTPELDEAADEVLVGDDDEDAEGVEPGVQPAGEDIDLEDDVLEAEEDDAVPFLEEDEDDDFEEDIEGIPGEGDEDR